MPNDHLSMRQGRVGLVVLVLLIVGLAGVLIWRNGFSERNLTPEQGKGIAEAFLKHLLDGHPDEAWESTTAEFKSAQGKESFVRSVRPLKFLTTPMDFVSVQTVTMHEQSRTEYLFRAATGESVRIVPGTEQGVWKVDYWTH